MFLHFFVFKEKCPSLSDTIKQVKYNKLAEVSTLPQCEGSNLRSRAQESHQTLGVKTCFTQQLVSRFLGKIWICPKKSKEKCSCYSVTLRLTTKCSWIVSYPRRHRQTLEDAASTSHTSPLLLSGRLGRRCPRCIERTPEQKSLNVSFCFFQIHRAGNIDNTKHRPAWCLHSQSS